jgi:hypothetical protein
MLRKDTLGPLARTHAQMIVIHVAVALTVMPFSDVLDAFTLIIGNIQEGGAQTRQRAGPFGRTFLIINARMI